MPKTRRTRPCTIQTKLPPAIPNPHCRATLPPQSPSLPFGRSPCTPTPTPQAPCALPPTPQPGSRSENFIHQKKGGAVSVNPRLDYILHEINETFSKKKKLCFFCPAFKLWVAFFRWLFRVASACFRWCEVEITSLAVPAYSNTSKNIFSVYF